MRYVDIMQFFFSMPAQVNINAAPFTSMGHRDIGFAVSKQNKTGQIFRQIFIYNQNLMQAEHNTNKPDTIKKTKKNKMEVYSKINIQIFINIQGLFSFYTFQNFLKVC